MILNRSQPKSPLMGGAVVTDLSQLAADIAFFAAPHGTPYHGIDNRTHAETGNAVRQAMAGDSGWLDHWDWDLDGPVLAGRNLRIADLGDLHTLPHDGPGNREKIEALTRAVLKANAIPMMFGGDDSVPIPFVQAFDQRGPLTILQVDAHIDWRDERLGERYGFSSTMRRASEMSHVKQIIQVGARGLGSARAAEVEAAKAWGVQFVPARELHADGIEAALCHIEPGTRVLITIDCDALDPGIMPAVQAPTPGGLSHQQLTGLVAGVIAKADLAGMDIIEFMPAKDLTGAAAYLAGRLMWHAVGRLARR